LVTFLIVSLMVPRLSSAAPPTADFSADPTFGVPRLIVSFTDLSSGNVDSWAWDFDGDSLVDSVVQNPFFQYLNPGVYTVTLTVSGTEGTDDEIKTDYIMVGDPAEPPLADFVGTPTNGVLPLNVQFTDQSTGGITDYYWEFGDGQTSTEQSPSHVYSAAGDFTVKLTVTGPVGLDLMGKVDYINVTDAPPSADFTATPTRGAAPLGVTFTDQSSGTIDTWAWDFDDDGTGDSTEQNPLFTYDTAGIYTVALTTTGPGGGVVKKKIDYMDVSAGPVADFSATPVSGVAPLVVTFTDLSEGTVNTWPGTLTTMVRMIPPTSTLRLRTTPPAPTRWP